jgi:hypothetical protein
MRNGLQKSPLCRTLDGPHGKQRDREAVAFILQGNIETGGFDVFLAHNSKDKPLVEVINEELKKKGYISLDR